MRLVRLDDVAPGGRGLDLHPRLTVLTGAPDTTTELLRRAFRSLVDGGEPPLQGWVEAHGIQLALTRDSLDTLGLLERRDLDPVLPLDATVLPPAVPPAPPAPPAATPSAVSPPPAPPVSDLPPTGTTVLPPPATVEGGPRVEMSSTMPPVAPPPGPLDPTVGDDAGGADDPARTTRAAAEEDLRSLRDELRSVNGELMVRARLAEEARGGLDSFARADLEAARERVEAAAARLQQATADHEAWVAAASEHRAGLLARRHELEEERTRVAAIDPETVRDATEHLASVIDPPVVPDPATARLADRLDELLGAEEDRLARQHEADGQIEVLEARLADAEAELRAVEDQTRAAASDPATVRQLERVRDEIYDLEERGGRLGGRARRRADELRAEEAELLDRLGFDTYSSFVMGIPTARAEAERAMRVDAARARVETLRVELEQLRADSPGGSEERWNASEREEILDEASRLVGVDAAALGRLTSVELSELLRSRTLPIPPEVSAEVLSAAGRLAAALSAAGEEPPSTAIDPQAMLHEARTWLAGIDARHELIAALSARLDEVDRELARLDRERPSVDDGGRAADLRAELSSAEERVIAAERRLEAHLAAMAELADVRAEELELRDRQLTLESAIAERERLLAVIDRAAGEAAAVTADPTEEDTPEVGMDVVDGVGSEAAADRVGATLTLVPAPDDLPPAVPVLLPPPGHFGPVSREWRVLSRMGDLRRVGMVGSVPLLLTGLDATTGDTEALLHRIEVMSDLVQVVVVTDDERIAAWGDRLGPDGATVVRW